MKNHPQFKEKIGHIEGDTIVSVHHKSAVITLKPLLLETQWTKGNNIEMGMNQWF